jgi:hypothetical protein
VSSLFTTLYLELEGPIVLASGIELRDIVIRDWVPKFDREKNKAAIKEGGEALTYA